MASVPAEIQNEAQLPAETKAPEEGANPGTGNKFLLGLNRLTMLRQIALVVGVAAAVALGFGVVIWMQEPEYRPLLDNISDYSPTEVARVLQQHNIGYKIEPNSGALLVEAERMGDARMQLAVNGITSNRNIGYELLDQDTGLGTSQFMEATRFRRGLEGELARTISSLRNVRSARVHLALPKQSVFVRDRRKPSASVFVELQGARELDPEQVEAIVNLVASSVPEMDRKDVTVVDQRGRLLSQSHRSTDELVTMKQFEYARRVEETLNGRIASILEPILGPGRFRSEVSADLDFTAVEQAEETYNPDMVALRSEQTLDEQRLNRNQGGIPGALSNQPPGAATVPEVAVGGDAAAQPQGDIRRQRTRNYEVDRTVSYTRHEQGRVTRLTVAVVVDDIKRVNPATGAISYEPWSAEDLQRLTILVRDAVGYSAARGDSVNVINTPFAPTEDPLARELPWWEQAWFWNLVRYGMGTLVVLILIIGLLRLLRNLVNPPSASESAKGEGLAGGLEDLGGVPDAALTTDESADLLLPGGFNSLERQLNAVKTLVADDPGRVAQVVRQWINSDE